MTAYAFAEYSRIMILPAFWAEEATCECCRETTVSIGIGWLFWGVGIGFHVS